ncbi:hypothetical protein ODZ84_09795 [Chryseobacterium fluminis]|uniref:hypothetical protein n=1 Tax=Chryseobacterium fluminis TaxID=2983606 RepID=UPI0022574BD5|nr:hypothetical protein [Chryseobacterium sp. MMS21-Ot14]UZT99828.1 hypothetical protein ODZ84_09795 [Chryseobacterium sp. MMS21-Ot14]
MENISSSVIKSKFKRSKLNLNKTKLWEELSLSVQQIISAEINLIDNEQEIICYYNNEYWWILTNRGITIYDNKNISHIKLSEILNIELPGDIKKNSTNDFLKIFTQNIVETLKLEKSSWFVIVEILKFITKKNINVK